MEVQASIQTLIIAAALLLVPMLFFGPAYIVLTFKLFLGAIPFFGLGVLLSSILPVYDMSLVASLLGATTLFAFILMLGGSDDVLDTKKHKIWTLVGKIILFPMIIASSACSINMAYINMDFMNYLSIPMYFIAAKVYFGIRYNG